MMLDDAREVDAAATTPRGFSDGIIAADDDDDDDDGPRRSLDSFPLLVSRNESYLLIVVHSILRLIWSYGAPKTPFASVLLVAS